MNKTTKTILIVTGILAALGLISAGVYYWVYVPNQEKKEEEEKQKRLEAQRTYEKEIQGTDEEGMMRFNDEGELDYSMTELMGKILLPKPTLAGGEGYAWLRSSALVDNGWWTNQITKVSERKKIGKVVDFKKGSEKGYAYTWYKVEIDKDLAVSETFGWVRADAVIYSNGN